MGCKPKNEVVVDRNQCYQLLGALFDDDAKQPSTIMIFVPFFAMTTITLIIFAFIYYVIKLTKKKIQLNSIKNLDTKKQKTLGCLITL